MSPNSLGWCLTDGRNPNVILKITFSQSDFTSRQATVHACGCWCSDPRSVTCNPSRPVMLAGGAGCAAWNPKGHSVAKPSSVTPAATGDAVAMLSLGAMSWASLWLLVFPKFITCSSHICAQGESGSSFSGLWGLLCQKPHPLIADVSLHK